MADEHDSTPPPAAPAAQPQSTSGSDIASGYLSHVRSVLENPDDFFVPGTRSPKIYGLITIGAFLLLVLLQSLLSRARFSSWGFEASHLGHAIQLMLAIGIPIAALLFVFKWQAGRSNGPASLDFYIEKFGAALILPSLLLLVALPLIVLKATIHSWFSGAAFVLVYLAVFLVSYTCAAPERLKVAVVMTLGFYAAYRLLLLLF